MLTIGGVFSNQLFRDLIVSLCSTYILYFVASFMFFEPWHMFTSFVQYLLLSPSYINVLNVYAFCNTHDISWGTKGPDVPPPIKNGTVKTKDGQTSVNVPSDDKDLDEQYEAEMSSLQERAVEEVKKVDDVQKQKDYYAGVRSGVVLAWMFTNFALSAAILNSAGLDRLVTGDEQTIESNRSKVYLGVILWTVAALSAFRFLGATWFLVLRMVSSRCEGGGVWAGANKSLVPRCVGTDWLALRLGLGWCFRISRVLFVLLLEHEGDDDVYYDGDEKGGLGGTNLLGDYKVVHILGARSCDVAVQYWWL